MTGRAWAYLGAILGGFVSVAANIAHCYIHPAGAPKGWSPPSGAVALSALWPVMVLVAVEILGRVVWPAGWRWWVLRWGGLTPVTAVAAIVSYRHLSGLLASYGEDAVVAVIGPLAIDGLMVISSAALLSLSVQASCPDGRTGTDRLSGRTDRPGQPVRTVADPVPAEGPLTPDAVRLPDADVACPDMSGLRDPLPVPWRTSWADTPPVTCTDSPGQEDSVSASSPEDPGRVEDTVSARTDRPGQVSGRTDTGHGQARTGVRDRVWELRRRDPDMPATEIARQLDVTERTVRRHLSTCPDIASDVADTSPELADTVSV